MNKLCSFTLLVVLVALLNACGGVEGSSSASGIEGTGAPMRVISGPIDSQENSVGGDTTIVVNDISFTVPSSQSNLFNANVLAEGQVVILSGLSETDNTVEQIDSIVNVLGPVSHVNPLTNALIVLGQTIVLNSETRLGDGIDLNQLEALPLSTVIKVSGLITANGKTIATRVDIIDSSPVTEFSVLGQITHLDLTNQTLMINELLVDFNSADINISNANDLKNGMNILVTGSLENRVFKSTGISELALSSLITNGLELDVEALISRFESLQNFDINGVQAMTNDNTLYTNGEASDLNINSSIRIMGRVNDEGILVADHIEFIPLNVDVLITAFVENATVIENNADIVGHLQLLGLNTYVSPTTEFGNGFDQEDSNSINFSSIQLTDTLDVRGIFDGKDIILTKITRIDAQPSVRLRGLVNTTSNILLIVQGVQVTISPQATEFVGTNGSTISYFDFLVEAPGKSVFVEGRNTNNVISADIVQLIPSPNGLLFIGTSSSDRLIGTDRNDIIIGGDDNDQLVGGAGNDILNGGNGADFIEGNSGDDELYGDNGFDVLLGGLGRDLMDGGPGGNVAIYDRSPTGIIISLDGTLGQGGHAEGDTLVNIASIDGTLFDDILSGSTTGSHLRGLDGNDVLNAGSAPTELSGGLGNDQLNGGISADHLFGGEDDDELLGFDGNDYLNGGPGADVIDGGENTLAGDTVDYSNSSAGITLTIGGLTASGGDAAGDMVVNVEIVIGSNFDDDINGDINNNTIDGRLGNDILNGGDGDDSLNGNLGNDILTGGPGNDIFVFTRDGGLDIITQQVNNVAEEDIIRFEDNLTPQDLWFTVSNGDLHIYIIGTTDRITVTNWQNNSISTYLSGANILGHDDVQTLVDAMSGVVPVEDEILTIPSSVLSAVASAVTSAWN